MDAAFRLANAVSIADRGVRLAHAAGGDVSRSGISEHPAITNDIVAMPIQATMLGKLDTSENESNGGNYEDAGCQHQDFGKVKARKYGYFRHGHYPRVPDTDDRKPCERGRIVLGEPRRRSTAAMGHSFGAQTTLAYLDSSFVTWNSSGMTDGRRAATIGFPWAPHGRALWYNRRRQGGASVSCGSLVDC